MTTYALSPLAGAGWQFLDNSGNVLTGGELHTFLAGTTTPTQTWADYQGNTSNGLFVELDSAGRPPAEVWLDSSLTYKFVLQNAAGALIRTYDHVPPIPGSTQLSGPTGAGLVGYAYNQVYATGTVGNALQIVVDAHAAPFLAVGDGTTDDRAAIQAALNTGFPVALRANRSYLLTSGLSHVTGSGLVCLDGYATLKAKTGPGGFNIRNETGSRIGLDRNMFICNQTDNVVLRNIAFTTDGATEVVLHGWRMYGGMATIGYDASGLRFDGFASSRAVAVGGLGAGKTRSIHIESVTNFSVTQGGGYWTGTPQSTAFEIDNDKPSSTASTGGIVRIDRIYNLLFSGSALVSYGQETDGVNIVTQGVNSTSGWDFKIGSIEYVGEPLDIQGWSNSFEVGRISNSYNDSVKLIHGAQFNNITVGAVENSGRAVVAIFGSNTAPTDRDTLANNIVIGAVKNPGTYGLGVGGTTSIVLFANSGFTYKPTKNTVRVDNIVGNGVDLDYVVRDGGSASNNDNLVFIGKASGWFISTCDCPPSNVRVKALNPSLTTLTLSADQTGIVTATDTKVAWDTVLMDLEGLADTANNKIVVDWPGLYYITTSVMLNGQAIGAQDQAIVQVRQNVSVPVQTKGLISFTGKEETHTTSGYIYIAEDVPGTAGADITTWFRQDTGSNRTISASDSMTFLSVARIS